MDKLSSRWTSSALVVVVGVVLLAFYGTARGPQELLLFHNVVKQLLTCTGTGCGANGVPSGREWYKEIQMVPLSAKKLEAGSITWTQAAADAIVGEIERVQFPEDCSSTRWLAIQQLSDGEGASPNPKLACVGRLGAGCLTQQKACLGGCFCSIGILIEKGGRLESVSRYQCGGVGSPE